MKNFFLIVVLVVFGLIQTSSIHLNLLFLVLALLSFVYSQKRILLLSFVAGLVLDIFLGGIWGTSSILFLLLIFFFITITKSIQLSTIVKQIMVGYLVFLPIFFFFLLIAEIFLRSTILGKLNFSMDLTNLLVTSLLFAILFPLFAYFSARREKQTQLKLKLD